MPRQLLPDWMKPAWMGAGKYLGEEGNTFLF
ncbi:hypothetical protein ABH892_004871 [Paenibacillus sp. RC254]